MSSAPVPRLTMITIGVSNMRASIAFYEALGFTRKFCATGEAVASFETGGTAIGLFPWDQLAQDVTLPEHPRPAAFRRAKPPLRQYAVGDVFAGSGIDDQKRHLPFAPNPQLIETAIAPHFPVVEPPVRVKLDEDRQLFEIAHLSLRMRSILI